MSDSRKSDPFVFQTLAKPICIAKQFPELAKRTAKALELAAGKKAVEAAKPLQMFLPGLEAALRAMPNHLARSSLYAPIAPGRRKFHHNIQLVTRADAIMSYTGEQMDEADADLNMQLIQESMRFPLGTKVTFKRAAMLRAIGRHTGQSQYLWLHRRMKAFTVATLFIEARESKKHGGAIKYRIGDTDAFHLVQSFRYDEDSESYTFTIDPRWSILFGNREFALIDWSKRMQIGRAQNMAKALQRLLATSSNLVQWYELRWLKDKMQYTGRLRDFKGALERALRELVRLKIVVDGRIEKSTKGNEQLTVKLPGIGTASRVIRGINKSA